MIKPTEIQHCTHPACPVGDPEQRRCDDAKSSQGLLPDVGHKESIDKLSINLKKVWPLRLDVPQELEEEILVGI